MLRENSLIFPCVLFGTYSFVNFLPRYNLSRKSAVPVARNSMPKVNREVQASLSEEENCTLSFELPFHPSSLPPTAHVTSSSEEIEPIQSNGLPRFSTAFSDQNPANRTTTEAIDISIDPCEGPSIVQQSLPEPTTSFVPRQESDASPSEDQNFTDMTVTILTNGWKNLIIN